MKNIFAKAFKSVFWTLIIGATVIIVVSAIAIIGFIIYFSTSSDMPKPEVKYGEFPCKLVYELNGKQETIEDIIVCEFNGYKLIGENGRYRQWKTHLKSGNERLTLLDLRSSKEVNEFEQTMLELYFYYGNAEYYMNDIGDRQRNAQELDRVSYHYQTTDGTIGGSSLKAEEAYEKYKIKLISWEAALPIENTFK